MIFTLEALEAKFGDALLLQYGPPDAPQLIVIDAGPQGVYSQSVRPRLRALRDILSPDAPLPIRLLMVSHIDGDHITGVLSLTRELRTRQEDGQPLPYQITTLWHNSFDDLLGQNADPLSAALPAEVLTATSHDALPADLSIDSDTALVVASIPQGRDLRNLADQLGLLVNAPFSTLVTAPLTGRNVVDLGEGLSFTVIGPSQARIQALQAEWDATLARLGRGREAAAIAADFVDKSIPNLSSIIVLAEWGGRSMLLTGDARGDDILAGLRSAGLLIGGRRHVDLLKLPHHGSDRNVSTEFFQRITADHYIISADGTHSNPDIATLRMLSEARGMDHFTIYLTNEEPRLVDFFNDERRRGKPYDVVFRVKGDLSIRVDLGSTPGL